MGNSIAYLSGIAYASGNIPTMIFDTIYQSSYNKSEIKYSKYAKLRGLTIIQ